MGKPKESQNVATRGRAYEQRSTRNLERSGVIEKATEIAGKYHLPVDALMGPGKATRTASIARGELIAYLRGTSQPLSNSEVGALLNLDPGTVSYLFHRHHQKLDAGRVTAGT